MRVRDRDALDASHLSDRGNRRVIDVCDAVPEEVSAVCTNENRPLADGELRHGPDADDARVRFDDAVLVVACPQLRQGCPLLALTAYVLTLVLAD